MKIEKDKKSSNYKVVIESSEDNINLLTILSSFILGEDHDNRGNFNFAADLQREILKNLLHTENN